MYEHNWNFIIYILIMTMYVWNPLYTMATLKYHSDTVKIYRWSLSTMSSQNRPFRATEKYIHNSVVWIVKLLQTSAISHSTVKGYCGCLPALLCELLGQLCLLKELAYPLIPLNTALMVLQAMFIKSLKNQLIQLAVSYLSYYNDNYCPTLFLV